MGHTQHVPCITPRGFLVQHDEMDSTNEVEKMVFQSFPIDKLSLKHMTSREIEDLAGNSVSCRAAAAGWLVAFSAVSLPKWNALAGTVLDAQ
ncbi:unnamed protein product [Durusdinium trenchii]|uniref:Uncharacterized protein n=1 Tax=Durusdinium trenchii TaxID=1381693 RepID=A0ABP0NBD4_9DINO